MLPRAISPLRCRRSARVTSQHTSSPYSLGTGGCLLSVAVPNSWGPCDMHYYFLTNFIKFFFNFLLFSGLAVLFYNKLKYAFPKEQQESTAVQLGCSSAGYGLAAAMTNPFDVVKTRRQVQASNPALFDYKNAVDCAGKILKREGALTVTSRLAQTRVPLPFRRRAVLLLHLAAGASAHRREDYCEPVDVDCAQGHSPPLRTGTLPSPCAAHRDTPLPCAALRPRAPAAPAALFAGC